MPSAPRTPRLSDVAEAAGVSPSTVSRALSGSGRMSATTRMRVVEAAERLRFRPDALAQFFATGRSRTVGVMTHKAHATFTMPVLVGATAALGAKENAVLLSDGLTREDVERFRGRRVDSLLVIGDGLGEHIRSVTADFSVPVAYAFGVSDDPRDVSFISDGVMAGRLAAQHLLDIGRTKVAHVTAQGDRAADERVAGLQGVLDAAGLPLVGGAPVRGTWHRAWGVEAGRRLLADRVDVDAVFCGNDQIAGGLLEVLRDAGVRVPDDVAVVGVDNWPDTGSVDGERRLTSVDPLLGSLGRAAAEHLLSPDPAGAVPGVRSLPCELVVGDSTVPGPTSR
jgi:LacI family transcriptional regulator